MYFKGSAHEINEYSFWFTMEKSTTEARREQPLLSENFPLQILKVSFSQDTLDFKDFIVSCVLHSLDQRKAIMAHASYRPVRVIIASTFKRSEILFTLVSLAGSRKK